MVGNHVPLPLPHKHCRRTIWFTILLASTVHLQKKQSENNFWYDVNLVPATLYVQKQQLPYQKALVICVWDKTKERNWLAQCSISIKLHWLAKEIQLGASQIIKHKAM